MSRVSTVTPREQVVSTHWIGSPKSVIGRGRMKYSPVRAKIFAEYVETTGESPVTQSPLEIFEVRFRDCLQEDSFFASVLRVVKRDVC